MMSFNIYVKYNDAPSHLQVLTWNSQFLIILILLNISLLIKNYFKMYIAIPRYSENMLNVCYPEIRHRFNMSTEILHWTTRPLFFVGNDDRSLHWHHEKVRTTNEYASSLRIIFCKRQKNIFFIHKLTDTISNTTRGSVGWGCVAHLSFCFEET